MAKEGTSGRSIGPSEVTVTITVAPPARDHRRRRERPTRSGVLTRTRTALAVALALALLGGVIAAVLDSRLGGGSAGAGRARSLGAEKAAIAAAFGYRYPLRCLTVAIAAGEPDYARAEVDRTNGCRRYHGYVDATFHRVDGTWRLVLDEGQLFVPNSFLLRAWRARYIGAGKAGTADDKGSQSRTAGAGAVGAAYRYRLPCFNVGIALHDPRFGQPDFDRTMCGRPAHATSVRPARARGMARN